MELTNEQKRLLLITSMHLKSYGKKDGRFEIESGYGDVYWDQKNFYTSDWRSEIQCPITEKFRTFCVEIFENYINDDLDSENRYNIYFNIKVEERTFDIEIVGYYNDTESFGNSWSLEEISDNENVMTAIDLMKQRNIKQLNVAYDGSGDSGGIEDWSTIPSGKDISDLEGLLEDWCYNELENHHGGWEINEGSSGYFYFYPNDEENTVELSHNQNIESSDTDEFLETKF
jgi:hypothetical protein